MNQPVDDSRAAELALDGPPLHLDAAAAPGVVRQLALAPWRARGRRQGVLARAGSLRPRAIVVEGRGLRLDRARVERFRAVCADRGDPGRAPAAFLETLFLGPMASIALHPAFPLSPLGLVHLRQRIEQRRGVDLDEALDQRCALVAMRQTTRGLEVDVDMQLHAAGDAVWSGQATLLSRSPAPRTGPRPDRAIADDKGRAVLTAEVSADTGRRYARASGDYNPHHLHLLSARLVGFRRPIAHGMWTLARSLAALGATDAEVATLTVEARFKRPLFLPGRLAVHAGEGDPQGAAGLAFTALHPGRGEPYLSGRLWWTHAASE